MNRYCLLLLTIMVGSFAAGMAGCQGKAQPAGGTNASLRPQFTAYPLRGKIVATDAAKGEVTIDHQAIPGFMQAMTMPYKLRDTRILGELHPGDLVTADVLVSQTADAEVFVDHFVVVGQAKPDYRPAIDFHVPQAGDEVPNFKLTNQDGRQIHLKEFRGQALLITFIYTRCPLPDFCPRVTRNFATLDKLLKSDPGLARTHLICASFDPKEDTPGRLRAYAAGYIGGSDSKAFERWDFAVPGVHELPTMAHFFDVGLTNEEDGTITHSLSTTLIGPDGRVVRFYPGNEWTAQDLLTDLKKLLHAA